MNSRPTTRTAKPKARVAYFSPDFTYWTAKQMARDGLDTPCAVIPCRTKAEARRIVKLFGMSEEELAETVAKTLGWVKFYSHPLGDPMLKAKRILAVLGLGAKGEK